MASGAFPSETCVHGRKVGNAPDRLRILPGMDPLPLDIHALRAAASASLPLEVVLFPDSGQIRNPLDAGCLSQWAISPFRSGDHDFHSAEQAMMHGKALLFGDHETAARILRTRTPFQARELGFQVRGFSEEVWTRERVPVVTQANLAKFRALPALRDYLLSTGTAILAEASPTDLVWGTGVDSLDISARNPLAWPGLNLLGFALMQVRAMLSSPS